jgi:hypothetical protein
MDGKFQRIYNEETQSFPSKPKKLSCKNKKRATSVAIKCLTVKHVRYAKTFQLHQQKPERKLFIYKVKLI